MLARKQTNIKSAAKNMMPGIIIKEVKTQEVAKARNLIRVSSQSTKDDSK
jgi:hypothetical protein